MRWMSAVAPIGLVIGHIAREEWVMVYFHVGYPIPRCWCSFLHGGQSAAVADHAIKI